MTPEPQRQAVNLVAAHLAKAVEQHRRWCRDQGIAVPAQLFDLVSIVSASHEQSPSPGRLDPGDDAGVPLALTYDETGRLLGVSASTVTRLVRAGTLRPIAIGRAKRVPRCELQRYIDHQLDHPTGSPHAP